MGDIESGISSSPQAAQPHLPSREDLLGIIRSDPQKSAVFDQHFGEGAIESLMRSFPNLTREQIQEVLEDQLPLLASATAGLSLFPSIISGRLTATTVAKQPSMFKQS